MAKSRPPIPPKIASSLLMANRHACCVCQNYQVQIHHIDDDPSNNNLENLAALCLPHHDQATMTAGLTRKLKADDVRQYKQQWEAKCSADVQALSRDRLRFYATLYKNPPRIRELFGGLTSEERLAAISQLTDQIDEDIELHREDQGFQWQANPGDNDLTKALMFSLRAGELWPRVLHRVEGHADDPDYPIDMSPPYGMTTFHGFDLYCQLMVRTMCIIHPPIALESLWVLGNEQQIDHFCGSLVSFRERAIGKSIFSPKLADQNPLGRVQFRVKRHEVVHRAILPIKNMYVFSDTAVDNLEHSKVCGVALLEDAQEVDNNGVKEIHVGLKPLIIGIGGLGQSEDGWWDIDQGEVGSVAL